MSIVEVLIAALILGILVGGLAQLQRNTVKARRVPLEQDALARALYGLQTEIVKDDRFLPPQEFPAAADPLDHRTLDPFLDDAEIAALRCFDLSGVEVVAEPAADGSPQPCTANTVTFFQVRYVKFRQPDVSFYKNTANPAAMPSNEINRIPLALYRLRVDYEPDATGKTLRRLYLSRLMTGGAVY